MKNNKTPKFEAPACKIIDKNDYLVIDEKIDDLSSLIQEYESRLNDIKNTEHNTLARYEYEKYISYFKDEIRILENSKIKLSQNDQISILSTLDFSDSKIDLFKSNEAFDSKFLLQEVKPYFLNFFLNKIKANGRAITNSVKLLYRIENQYQTDYDTTFEGKNQFEKTYAQIEFEVSQLQKNFLLIIQNLLNLYNQEQDILNIFEKLKEKLTFINRNEYKAILDIANKYIDEFKDLKDFVYNHNSENSSNNKLNAIDINNAKKKIEEVLSPFFSQILASNISFWIGEILIDKFSFYDAAFKINTIKLTLSEVKDNENNLFGRAKVKTIEESDIEPDELFKKLKKIFNQFLKYSKIKSEIQLSTPQNPTLAYLDMIINNLKNQRERLSNPTRTIRMDVISPEEYLAQMTDISTVLNEINQGLDIQIKQGDFLKIDFNCLESLKNFEARSAESTDLRKLDRRIAYSGIEGLQLQLQKINDRCKDLRENEEQLINQMLTKVSELASVLDTHTPVNINTEDKKILLSLSENNQQNLILYKDSYVKFTDEIYEQLRVLAQNPKVISLLWFSFEESNDFFDFPDSVGSEDKLLYWTSVDDSYDSILDNVLYYSPRSRLRYNWREGIFESPQRNESGWVYRPKSLIYDLINNGDFRRAFMGKLKDVFKIKADGSPPSNIELTSFSKSSKEFTAAINIYNNLLKLEKIDKEMEALKPLSDLIELVIYIEKIKKQKSDLEEELKKTDHVLMPFILYKIENILAGNN